MQLLPDSFSFALGEPAAYAAHSSRVGATLGRRRARPGSPDCSGKDAFLYSLQRSDLFGLVNECMLLVEFWISFERKCFVDLWIVNGLGAEVFHLRSRRFLRVAWPARAMSCRRCKPPTHLETASPRAVSKK